MLLGKSERLIEILLFNINYLSYSLLDIKPLYVIFLIKKYAKKFQEFAQKNVNKKSWAHQSLRSALEGIGNSMTFWRP